MSDSSIMYGLLITFLLLGAILPFVNSAFDVDITNFNAGGIEDEVGQANVSATDVFLSMFIIFFWTFGSIPFWLDLTVILAMRIMFAWFTIRVIRGVGG